MKTRVDELTELYEKATSNYLADNGAMMSGDVLEAWLKFGFDLIFKAAVKNNTTIQELAKQTSDYILEFGENYKIEHIIINNNEQS